MSWWWALYALGAIVVLYAGVAVVALLWPDNRPAFVSRGGDYFLRSDHDPGNQEE